MRNSNVRKLTTCAIMLALSFVLSYVKIFSLPFEGSVTLFSMLPICLVSVMYGLGWGLGTAFCYSWLQILQGGVFTWGLSPIMLIGSLMLDYIVAFTAIGLSGIFRRKGKIGICVGTGVACVVRFLSHFTAGFILWANVEEFVAFGQSWVNHPYLYSLCYNGVYMLPETILTVIGMIALVHVPQIMRIVKAN